MSVIKWDDNGLIVLKQKRINTWIIDLRVWSCSCGIEYFPRVLIDYQMCSMYNDKYYQQYHKHFY